MIYRPIVSVATILKHNSVLHDSYVEQDVYATLSQGNQVEELVYHVHDNLLYHLVKLCIP